MGKASRRKRRQGTGEREARVLLAGNAPAPNFEGALAEATRYAIAMITSVHASPGDLPGLITYLDRPRHGVVAYALIAQLAMDSARELADARRMAAVAVLNNAADVLRVGKNVNRPALDRALGTVRKYAELLDGMHATEVVIADLDANVRQRQAALSYLIALTQITHQVIAVRCAELGEDVTSFLQRISLPAAEAHGNEIEADALENYVEALMAERLANEPLLLAHVAEALVRDPAALPDGEADEFGKLGGSDRLRELAGGAWDDMDAEDKRLVVIALLKSILVDSEGGTVAGRVRLTWRF